MFDQLFVRSEALTRQLSAPLVDERRQYLTHCAVQGMTRSTLDRYPLPRVEQIVEVRYLYCHPGPEGKLIQAKYFGKVRDDINVAECAVYQLKVKSTDTDAAES